MSLLGAKYLVPFRGKMASKNRQICVWNNHVTELLIEQQAIQLLFVLKNLPFSYSTAREARLQS